MEHYFIARKHRDDEYFTFNDTLLGHPLSFRTVPGVFNYKGVDQGTRTLIDALAKLNISGKVLDIGCGLGIIGITIAKHFKDVQVTMSDINTTCVALAEQNRATNRVNVNVVAGDAYATIAERYNWVVSNPPIKAGKKVLFDMVLGAKNILERNGNIVIVIRKNLGMDSLRKAMIETYGNCTILDRNKGYYILMSKKDK